MNQEQYEHFVERIERESERHPALYKLKLGGMAVLGYGYVGAMLLLLLALLALFGWMVVTGSAAALAFKLGFVIVVFVWMVLQAMFVRLEPPTGVEIKREDAPELFALVEEVRAAAAAPHAHQVLVTNEFNAAVVQHPRLGVFGWPRNYLILGLPLMQALSVEEFRAVIAHEFGHLSGAHGKFGAWIYRLRAGWARLAGALEQSQHWGRFLFVPFFKWYAPAFSAYSFVQARRQEYEADRVSARVAGAATAGAALVRVELQASHLDREYWQRIFRDADSTPQPKAQPYTAMRSAFAQPRPNVDAGTLEAALKRRTGCDDTHPSLKDRLHALSVRPMLPAQFAANAADALLGSLAVKIATQFDEQWRSDVSQWWVGRHQFANESRRKLEQLNAAAASGELSIDDAYRRAQLTEELLDGDAAREQYDAVLARSPEHASTLFALGRLALAADDEGGLALLKRAVQIDQSSMQDACSLIVAYLRRHGRNEEARPYIDDLVGAQQRDDDAMKERNVLTLTDRLLPHGLSGEELSKLCVQLESIPELYKAWLVRKQTKNYPDIPMYVLAVTRRTHWWKYESTAAAEQLVQRLSKDVAVPGETLIIPVQGENKSFLRGFKKTPQSLVYTRGKDGG